MLSAWPANACRWGVCAMIILILAGGNQERWGDHEHPKQLVDIGGETLLMRIVRQCREQDHEPIIVTHDERLKISKQSFEPQARRWTVETLLSTCELWEDRTVVLLGDVIFTDEALHKIMLNRAPIQVFGRKELRYRLVGRYYEIFAISFDCNQHQQIVDTLQEVLVDASTREDGGKLRTFYEMYCGLPLRSYQHEDIIFYPIEDWTEDIDAPEDYEQFKAMIIQRGWV